MRTILWDRLILLSLLLFSIVPSGSIAQRSAASHPLRGYPFIGASATGNMTIARVDPGLIPAPNSSFALSAPEGAGFEFGLSYAVLLPELFVSTATTVEFRLLYTRLVGTSSGSGLVETYDRQGGRQDILVRQAETTTAIIAGVASRIAFELRPMARATPTILLGVTLGHITDIRYNIEYTPGSLAAGSGDGLPDGAIIPARRWFYSALHLGGGGRISLGDPATSPAIVPEMELLIPLTSLARYSNWLPFGVRAGIGLRWPI